MIYDVKVLVRVFFAQRKIVLFCVYNIKEITVNVNVSIYFLDAMKALTQGKRNYIYN